MKKLFFVMAVYLGLAPGESVNAQAKKAPVRLGEMVAIPEAVLRDKIKGGWAGQTIGVTFGGPYEFRYDGTFIQDYQPLEWNKDNIKNNMLNNAGLYDDIYM